MTLCGYLMLDSDDVISLAESKTESFWGIESIPDKIHEEFGYRRLKKGTHYLGGKATYLPDTSIRIYYTKEKCSLEEAQASLIDELYGTMEVQSSFTGYSEYTITGLELDKFIIGGHNLKYELADHMGEYCWIVIESEEEDEY